MKICVYAISKNEEKFVKRWYKSMQEADEIYVLDTGSTDQTVTKLKQLGVHVQIKKITPWRFDTARNLSLELVPYDTDICVCTDLDEVFEPGWRKKLEENWKPETTTARYTYNWSLDQNNKPIVTFLYEKIHSRNNYTWIHPVHEVLKYKGTKEIKTSIPSIILNHYPDKLKSRNSYLNLLELSVQEDNQNDRNLHYLGREYLFHQKYDQCIKTLKKHLNLKNATWKPERSASMRFIARSYKMKKELNKAIIWYKKAIKETPNIRDPYVELALLYYEEKKYKKLEEYLLEALRIRKHDLIYNNEPFSWDTTIYDLLSISYYYQEKYLLSLFFINLALEMEPENKRLQENKNLISKKIEN